MSTIKQLTTIDKPTANELIPIIVDAVEAALAKYGVTVEAAGGLIAADHTEFTAKVRIKANSSSAVMIRVTAEADDWKRYAKMFGLPEDGMGCTFSSNGRSYTIIGIRPARPKYPVLASCVEDGKRYKFSAADVVRHLAIQAAMRGGR